MTGENYVTRSLRLAKLRCTWESSIKWIVKKQDGIAWTGLNWLMAGWDSVDRTELAYGRMG